MKITILLILLFTHAPLVKGQIIDSVNVYFLPWKFNIEGEISEELVRHYPGHTKVVRISEREKIDSLMFSLSILNLRYQSNEPKDSFSPRMIIDIFSHDKRNDPHSPVHIFTLKLDQAQNLVFRDCIYYKNFVLEEWIKKFVLTDI